jgi:hypothetical protein
LNSESLTNSTEASSFVIVCLKKGFYKLSATNNNKL